MFDTPALDGPNRLPTAFPLVNLSSFTDAHVLKLSTYQLLDYSQRSQKSNNRASAQKNFFL